MVGLWHWVERNSAGLSLLVPFLAIGGGLLGNWLGAKIQAKGGLAQASAAREAARITAEAARLSELRNERRLAIADFMRTSRRHYYLVWDQYRREREDELGPAWDALDLAYAEIELTVPHTLLRLAKEVMNAAQEARELVALRGPAARAMALLLEPASDGSTPGRAAHAAVMAARAAVSCSETDCANAEQEALRELERCGLLDSDQMRQVRLDVVRQPLAPLRQAHDERFKSALTGFAVAAREALGANREGGVVEWIPQA
ncbi:hypothetical protein [Streptomyces sp. NBC_01205]|uniref:hypothetical protein n=1 Tax=Streptomyces sp. NBC_01205 TaxID=2903771 RepID=UPI002E141126|nr:hypothetical protein OG573_43255 [Streptomyces sp. NBC_01205]